MTALTTSLFHSTASLLILLMMSCNENSTLSSKDKKSADDDENIEADMPVEVSGAFLTCDWIGDPSKNDPDIVIGCTVMGRSGDPLDRKNRSFEMTLHNADNSMTAMATTDAPLDSGWHKLARLPSTHRDSGYLKMTMSEHGANEKSFTLNTYDIGKSISLGNQVQGDEGDKEANTAKTGSSLTKVTTHSQWIDIYKGKLALKLSDFCGPDGTLRTQLSDESDLIITLADEFLQTSTSNKNITIKNSDISLASPICFVRFNELGGSRELVHENKQKTCFYLHTGNSLHMVNVAKATTDNSNFNLETLKKFAGEKACQ